MILIVDDKPENIFSLRSILELNGFGVDTADSGEEALKKVLKNSYNLIILDVQMPGMDGFEVAEALTGYSKAQDIPIIFLSAVNTEKRFITKGYNSGGIDYITKPVDPDILILKAKTFIRLYEQAKELNEIHATLKEEIEVRRRAQDELHKNMEELRSVMESLPQIAFTTNAQGEVEFVNEHWFAYSQRHNEMPQAHPADEMIKELWLGAIEKDDPFEAEIRIKRLSDNAWRYHLLRIIPIKQHDKIVRWVGTFTDIDEQKMVSELLEQRVKERTSELQEINTALEVSNHDLQQFASVASHDLKEPLRKIQVFSSIIRDRYLKGEEQNGIGSYVHRIIDSSERMSGLINDLLNYSRLSVNSLFKFADINKILREILDDLELAITEKKAVIRVDEMPAIEVIPGQIRQVFQNIISNALKFSKPDVQPVIDITAELVKQCRVDSPASSSGKYCRIVISDNGIGFDQKYVDKIFTLFQRLNSQDAYEGTGIGMAIARKIIDKHKGVITAEGKVDEGATFIIVLPLQQKHADVAADAQYQQ